MAGRHEHRLFVAMAVTALLVVVWGFTPTFFLRRPDLPPLPGLVVAHGVVYTAWALLFLGQALLVTAGRVRVHRRVGLAGTILMLAMIPLGYFTAIAGARRGHNPARWPDALAFLAIPLVDVAVFGVLATAGVLLRRRPAAHKRLMLLATLSLLAAPLGRIPVVGDSAALTIGVYALLALICPLADWIGTRRVHPAFIWGTALVVGTLPLRVALGFSDAWHRVAEWLTR
jgi:hypothetical protein